VWKAALDTDGRPRTGAQVAELTRHLRPARDPWPPGMRVIARRERPHPGAQLRLTDADGWRITLFAGNVRGGRITTWRCSTGCGPEPRTESAA
jgi:hypothetical protein